MPAIDRITGATALASAATGFALALPLGATLQGAGGLAQAAVPVALLAGAAAVLVVPRRTPDQETAQLRPPPGSYPASTEAPALSPEAWLGRVGAMALPRAERAAAIEAGLMVQLRPGDGDQATALLLDGLMACARPGEGRDGPGFLRALAEAMRLDAPHRAKALGLLAGPRAPMPEIQARHHYVETRLLAAFHEARDRCGIASAAFSWLRFHRRAAWFALNSVGRPAPYVEGALALSHFERERREGMALAAVESAPVVDGLMAVCDRIEAGMAA